MSDRMNDLLVKAVRLLPQAEQDEVLGALLHGRVPPDASSVGIDPSGGINQQAEGPRAARQLIGTSSIYVFPPDLPDQERHDVMEAMDKLKVLPVRLPAADYERLRSFAAERGFSMAVVVRTLVERFLKQQRQV